LVPWAAVLSGGDPGALEDVRSGAVGVQDEGSQLVTLALANVPVDGSDALWLDTCAGPGGKAALLAGWLPNEARDCWPRRSPRIGPDWSPRRCGVAGRARTR